MSSPRIVSILSLAAGLLLIAAGCSPSKSSTNSSATTNTTVMNTNVPSTNQVIDATNTNTIVVGPAATVSITSSGFSPSSVTVKVGQTVTWTNNDSRQHWPAVDPHPAHTNLGGFDSFGLSAAETYSYTFTKAGTWTYHDHLFSSQKGTVVVTP